jgi:hypothetical protein
MAVVSEDKLPRTDDLMAAMAWSILFQKCADQTRTGSPMNELTDHSVVRTGKFK